jgi:ankyrin repeat protein
MTKENTLFRTNEIKLKILKFIDSPTELLWFYIKDGNFQKFKETFEKNKIFCEMQDEDNNSLLNLAVQSNNYEIAEYLISVGADVNSQNVNL